MLSLPFPELLVELGLDSARVDGIVALTDSADASVCSELRSVVARDRADGIPDAARVSFFRSGPLYFMTLSHHRNPTDPIALDGPKAGTVYVFGADLRLRLRLQA